MQSKTWKTPAIKQFAQAVGSLQTDTERLGFLRDVATLSELREMAARWQAVQLVEAGVSYREIARQTGLSTTTVARVAYWLREGEGGYRLALKRAIK
jgi:TrpR-related protein YerC/YecD